MQSDGGITVDDGQVEVVGHFKYLGSLKWTEYRTDESIITELNTTRQLLEFVVPRKLSFCGHTIRDGGCELVSV